MSAIYNTLLTSQDGSIAYKAIGYYSSYMQDDEEWWLTEDQIRKELDPAYVQHIMRTSVFNLASISQFRPVSDCEICSWIPTGNFKWKNPRRRGLADQRRHDMPSSRYEVRYKQTTSIQTAYISYYNWYIYTWTIIPFSLQFFNHSFWHNSVQALQYYDTTDSVGIEMPNKYIYIDTLSLISTVQTYILTIIHSQHKF